MPDIALQSDLLTETPSNNPQQQLNPTIIKTIQNENQEHFICYIFTIKHL